jgi:uncharacterized membrane-anchored protein YitT (DUF2179 family)
MIILMNIPIFIVCFRKLGVTSVIGALAVMLLNSVMIDLFQMIPLVATDDPLLAAVYGGVLNGLGYGLVYSAGATSGGTDILAKLLRRHYAYINFGTLVMGLNVTVVVAFAIIFHKAESCMYTMIQMFISTRIINIVIYGPGISNLCYIITSRPEEITDAITHEMNRGVTFLKAEGAWQHQERPVVMCVIKKQEIAHLRAITRSVDEKAFLIVTEAKDVFGKGFESIYTDN